MIVQRVLKTDSLENVINGKFIFCKELKKGFIKGELSSLGLSDYSFENVATVIEGLTLEELESKGLNTVIFVDGEEKISQKANLEIEAIIAEMENPTAEMIFSLQSDRRLKRDYVDALFVQNIVDVRDAEAEALSLASVIKTESNLTFNNTSIDTGIAEQVNQTIFIDAVQTGFVGGDSGRDGLLGLHNADHGIAIQGTKAGTLDDIGISGGCNTKIEDSSKRFKIALVMGDTYCKIFIDGALASESSNPFIPYNGNINIGRSYNNRNFTGTVYKYSIHSRVLTDNECIKLTSIQE